MSLKILTCIGGAIELPSPALVLVDRADGGNLIVTPSRRVWDRSQLMPAELTRWQFLVAATAKAMLEVLPQLDGGCINYWDAGNWALHDEAEPRGTKLARGSRLTHLHLLGRSRAAKDPSWTWGEAPKFPDFRDRFTWARRFKRLTATECHAITGAVRNVLTLTYGFAADEISPSAGCVVCGHPVPALPGESCTRCPECVR